MLNPMDLSGRLYVVTGASSGIGRATAVLLSRLGACVILVARNRERLEQTCGMLEGTLHNVEVFDLAYIDDIPEWLRTLVQKYGRLDGLVHCAGVQSMAPVRLLDKAKIDDVLGINLKAAITLARGFSSRQVHKNSGGSIVFLTSVMGLVGQPARAAYAASKGGVIALTKSLAIELARDKIRVNSIAPAVVRTEMTEDFFQTLSADQITDIESMHPLGLGEPLDIAYGVAFLLSDAARWITGTTLVIDGGYTAQ